MEEFFFPTPTVNDEKKCVHYAWNERSEFLPEDYLLLVKNIVFLWWLFFLNKVPNGNICY